jgi:glycosyltransferase involved in cell wall biosynthesis
VRVLFLHSRYLSGPVSGENRVVDDEVRLLRGAGHDVGVLSPEPTVEDRADRVRTAASAIASRRAARLVRDTVRERAVEVVHVHNVFPTLSPAVLRAAHEAGAAVVMTLHNYRLMCLPATFLRDGRICEDCLGGTTLPGVRHACYRGSRGASAILAASLELHRAAGSFDAVTRFLAVGEFVKVKHVEAGIDPARILVKPNFVPAQQRRSGPGDRFLFMGRLAPEKGLDKVLRAWDRAPAAAGLDVVGSGPDERALRDSASSDGRIRFLGEVAPDRVPELLAGARALLVPSRWYEAAPRTIVEACASGVPVIASDIGALPDSVEPGVSGLLVPPERPDDWALAVGSLLDDETSVRLGAGAHRRWRERYSPEVGLADLDSCYRVAIEARRP